MSTTKNKAKEAPNRGQRVTDQNFHKSAQSFIARVAVSVFAWVCVFLAHHFGLVSVWLAIPMAGYFLAWLSFWAGAWMQFLWMRGDGKHENV